MPISLGVLMESSVLRMNFSRVKEYHIIFANWEPWLQPDFVEHCIFLGSNKGRDFAKVVSDFREKRDVVHLEALKALY